MKYLRWDEVKPLLLNALEALETVSWEESRYHGTADDARLRVSAKRGIRKLLAEMERRAE